MTLTKQPIFDTAAMAMAVVCGVHCLLTPLLLVFLPFLANSFWVHEDFHGWMLLLVVPTTILAVYMGCRKHKKRRVAVLSAVGLTFLLIGFASGQVSPEVTCCAAHAQAQAEAAAVFTAGIFSLSAAALWTSLGGLTLAAAHICNFVLCRRANCCHCKSCH